MQRVLDRSPALLHVTSPAPRGAWERILEQTTDSLVTQTPAWLDCIRSASRHEDASRLYEFGDGSAAVVPLARPSWLPHRWGGLESWPFDWGIGGPVTTPDFGASHARRVIEDLARQPAVRTGIRLNPFSAHLWSGAAAPEFHAIPQPTFVLDLPEAGFGQVWTSSFRGSVRRAVRRAERSDLEVEVDRTGRLVPVFYGLYQQSIVRWAWQSHEPLALARLRAASANPRRKFRLVAEQLGTSCATWVAWHRGDPVASIMVLRSGSQAKYWRGAMNQRLASPTRANDLLHKLAIEQACSEGCTHYHMGDARLGSSLAAFKEGFGARPTESWMLRREKLPLTSADRRMRGAVKRALRYRDP
jgi:hypothetical protein